MVDDDATSTVPPPQQHDQLQQQYPIHPSLARELIVSSSSSSSSTSMMMMIQQQQTKKNAPSSAVLKMTPDAALATSELLRLFVVEARKRAAIEAECEMESRVGNNTTSTEPKSNRSTTTTFIEAHHITRIAAELLMDFS